MAKCVINLQKESGGIIKISSADCTALEDIDCNILDSFEL